MKADEREFMFKVADNQHLTPRAIAAMLNMNPKRSWYLCQKWTDKGWYDYGVSVDTGWLTPQGVEMATGVEK